MDFGLLVRKKIQSPDETLRWISWWRMQGKKIVFTNGVFDILHAGHIHLLNTARSFGDLLIAGLNKDVSVKKIKPGRPINDEQSRSLLLASLEVVDVVILFEEETPLRLIETLKPEVLVKGGDYQPDQVVGKEVVEKNGGRVEIVPTLQGYSTTGLIEKLR